MHTACCVQQLQMHTCAVSTFISICCVPSPPAPPAMPAINRRQYQGDWSSWVFYGTHHFWQRAQSEPWHASELIIQRLHLAGLECPSEACSADICAGILALKHGPMATSLSTAELTVEFNAFKARDNACITPHIKHTKNFGLSTATAHVLVLFALCARSPYPFRSGARQAACRCQQRQDGARGLHHNPPSLANRAACFAPSCGEEIV